jgi:hypothetical protein
MDGTHLQHHLVAVPRLSQCRVHIQHHPRHVRGLRRVYFLRPFTRRAGGRQREGAHHLAPARTHHCGAHRVRGECGGRDQTAHTASGAQLCEGLVLFVGVLCTQLVHVGGQLRVSKGQVRVFRVERHVVDLQLLQLGVHCVEGDRDGNDGHDEGEHPECAQTPSVGLRQQSRTVCAGIIIQTARGTVAEGCIIKIIVVVVRDVEWGIARSGCRCVCEQCCAVKWATGPRVCAHIIRVARIVAFEVVVGGSHHDYCLECLSRFVLGM